MQSHNATAECCTMLGFQVTDQRSGLRSRFAFAFRSPSRSDFLGFANIEFDLIHHLAPQQLVSDRCNAPLLTTTCQNFKHVPLSKLRGP